MLQNPNCPKLFFSQSRKQYFFVTYVNIFQADFSGHIVLSRAIYVIDLDDDGPQAHAQI